MGWLDSPKKPDGQQGTTGQELIEKLARIFWIGIIISIILLVGVSPMLTPVFAQETQQSEEEPNNEQSEATEIMVGNEAVEVNGVLSFGDEDWFVFELTEGSSITIDYSGAAGEARLLSPDNTTLDSESPTIHRLQATADATGTYYLQLDTVASANGDYTFTIDTDTAMEDTETKEDDSTTTPTDIAVNTSTSNQSSDSETGDRADYCSEKGVQPVSPGSYSDHLSPIDRDVLVTNLNEDDFMTVNLTYDGAEDTRLAIYGDGDNVSFADSTGAPVENISNFGSEEGMSTDLHEEGEDQYIRSIFVAPGNTQFRVYTESDGVCLGFHTLTEEMGLNDEEEDPESSEAGGAGTWSLSFTENDADAQRIESPESPTSAELADLEQRIEELEEQNEELQQRMNELENETDTSE